jgi:hypothetical protein
MRGYPIGLIEIFRLFMHPLCVSWNGSSAAAPCSNVQISYYFITLLSMICAISLEVSRESDSCSYWFVARLTRLLQKDVFVDHASRSLSVFKESASALLHVMQTYGTNQLLERMSLDKTSEYAHWDDFLGNADKNLRGYPAPKYEDRIFSTSVAVNALIDIWAEDADEILALDKKTPDLVRDAIFFGANFLSRNYDSFPKENSFFSGSIKGVDGVPFFYPANVYEYLDGTPAGCDEKANSTSTGLLVGVSGLMDREIYAEKMKQKCFGRYVPVEFKGYNCDGCIFPYWSSPALTAGTTLLALSKARRLI